MDLSRKNEGPKDKDDSMQDVQEFIESFKGISRREGVDKLDIEITSPSRMVTTTHPYTEPSTHMDLEMIAVSPILDPSKKNQESKGTDEIDKFFQ